MSRTIRFHLDENVSNAVAAGLRQRGVDTTTSVEVDLISAPDAVQLEFSLTQSRVIFTHDTDFLRLHRDGIEHAGIVYCQKDRKTVGELVRGLILIWELLDLQDMRGQVEFIS
ncbi:DUF5615 family PIN-like protein [Gloeobacter morelensis]|uniref:DUF5615 family PIN-like protein n=1 Tax=Gloeobacter morelensis MG652769 TaxID=2781736 RepID=A0ABY3PGM3_9CYAN|nr:DUF5615 family PIN-like protein [Gloeobacter morelensis]UFP92789.1 DUF5615 family PIN-like protein [Gloeobacter morelensis MG652769]